MLFINNLLTLNFLQIQIDPFLGISDDLQVYVKPQADMREYGSYSDNQLATSILFELRNKIHESEKAILDVLTQNLSSITEVCPVDRLLYAPLFHFLF